MARESFLRRLFRKLFKNSVATDVFYEILSGSHETALKEATIDFICVAVQGDTPEIISERMALVTEIAVRNKGMVHALISGIIIITYGVLFSEPDDNQNRISLCKELRTSLAGNVKFVYGTAPGHFGNLGSATRMSFSFILPGFLEALGALAALPYGQEQSFRRTTKE